MHRDLYAGLPSEKNTGTAILTTAIVVGTHVVILYSIFNLNQNRVEVQHREELAIDVPCMHLN